MCVSYVENQLIQNEAGIYKSSVCVSYVENQLTQNEEGIYTCEQLNLGC